MEVYLIRHGQSTNNALMEDQYLRVQDPPLTEIGHRQAELTAEFFKHHANLEEIVRFPMEERDPTVRHQFTHIFCSPMLRALQTARPIATALGLKPDIWIDIHEIGGIFLEKEGVVTGFGGLTRNEILAQFPDYTVPEHITDAGWYDPQRGREHFSEMIGRAARVAWELRRRAQEETTREDKVGLVAHGAFIDALMKAFLRNLPTDQYFYWHYNTAITRVDLVEQGVVSIRYVNRVTHLPPDLVT